MKPEYQPRDITQTPGYAKTMACFDVLEAAKRLRECLRKQRTVDLTVPDFLTKMEEDRKKI